MNTIDITLHNGKFINWTLQGLFSHGFQENWFLGGDGQENSL